MIEEQESFGYLKKSCLIIETIREMHMYASESDKVSPFQGSVVSDHMKIMKASTNIIFINNDVDGVTQQVIIFYKSALSFFFEKFKKKM